MATMERKDALFMIIDIIDKHIDKVTEEEVRDLAEEIVDRMENIEIYDSGDRHTKPMLHWSIDDEIDEE